MAREFFEKCTENMKNLALTVGCQNGHGGIHNCYIYIAAICNELMYIWLCGSKIQNKAVSSLFIFFIFVSLFVYLSLKNNEHDTVNICILVYQVTGFVAFFESGFIECCEVNFARHAIYSYTTEYYILHLLVEKHGDVSTYPGEMYSPVGDLIFLHIC